MQWQSGAVCGAALLPLTMGELRRAKSAQTVNLVNFPSGAILQGDKVEEVDAPPIPLSQGDSPHVATAANQPPDSRARARAHA